MKNVQILNEFATLSTLKNGYGFIMIIHTNDHNPPHIHLYKKLEDVMTESYYTRMLIPNNMPISINDISVYKGDVLLTNQEKRILLEWFHASNKKHPNITNYDFADLIWDTYQMQPSD